MQGVRSSSLLGSIFRKIQFSTGISAVFTGRFFSAKRLTVIFCAPKCAPYATNLSAWLKLIRSGTEKLAGTTAELVDVQLPISDFLLLWHTSASKTVTAAWLRLSRSSMRLQRMYWKQTCINNRCRRSTVGLKANSGSLIVM